MEYTVELGHWHIKMFPHWHPSLSSVTGLVHLFYVLPFAKVKCNLLGQEKITNEWVNGLRKRNKLLLL